jgi:hypothetical protein
VVRELLAGGDAPVEYEDEDEGEDEDVGGGDDLDQIAFGGSGALWEVQGVSSGLKDRLKGACHAAVDAFFEALGDLEH